MPVTDCRKKYSLSTVRATQKKRERAIKTSKTFSVQLILIRRRVNIDIFCFFLADVREA
jgi:hypothetical protein